MDVRLNMTHVCSLWLSYQNTMLRFGPEPFSVPRQPITLRVFKAAECVDQWERSSTRKNLQFGLFSVCQTSQATIVQWGYCTLPQLLVRKYGFLFSDRRVCLRFQSFQWREDAQVCHCGEYNVFVQITASNVNVGCSWFDKTVRLKNNVHKTTHKFLFLCFIFLCIANMCLGCECETSLSFFLFFFYIVSTVNWSILVLSVVISLVWYCIQKQRQTCQSHYLLTWVTTVCYKILNYKY